MVHLALDRSLGQDLRRLLEGSGGQEGVGGQRGLGDTHEQGGGGGHHQLAAVLAGLAGGDAGLDGLLGVQILHDLHGGAGEQLGVAGFLDADLPHHLAHDDLNVLVIDVNALLTVGLLDFLDEVVVDGGDAADAQDLVGRQCAFGQLVALVDPVAVLAADTGAVRQGVADHLAVVGGDGHVADGDALALFHGHAAADLGQLGHLLGLAGLEQLLNTGKTLGDVAAGDAAGVEGTHGQLGARLTDGLGRDDTDGLALAHRLPDGQVHAIALGADTLAGAAGQDGADLQLVDAPVLQDLGVIHGKHVVLVEEDLAGGGIHHVADGIAALETLGKGLDDLAVLADLADGDALGGAAVVLADDDLLGDIDQTAGQITRVGGTQRGIGQALPGASGGDEVFQNGQTLTEVCLDGDLDGPAGGVSHQAAHAGQLTDLSHRTTGAGVGHHKDGVVAVQTGLQGLGDVLGGLLPGLNDQAVPLVVGQEAAFELFLDLHDLLLRLADQGVLLLGDGHIVDGDRQRAQGGVVVAAGLDDIQDLGGLGKAVADDALVDDLTQLLLAADEVDLRVEAGFGVLAVHKAQVLGDALVEDQAADRRPHQLGALLAVHGGGHADQDGHVQLQLALVVGQAGLGGAGEGVQDLLGLLPGGVGPAGLIAGGGQQTVGGVDPDVIALADGPGLHRSRGGLYRGIDIGGVGGGVLLVGQVIGAQDHILGRNRNRAAVLGPQEVVGGEHQDAGLCLGLGGQGDVDGHLVAVEVGVECRTNQGVQLNGAALHQHRLEGLDAQAVQGRRTVEHHGVLLDDEVQRIPDLGAAPVHHLLGGLDVVGQAVLHQLLHHEGAEELNGHLLGQAALINFQLRADHDDGTAGVVDTLAQQVLTEAALLALQHIGQGLQGAVVGAGDGTAAAAVVDQGVHSLLEHPLLVADDDVGGGELDQALEAVVAVDDPAIQVVQVGGGEPAAVQLDHGANFGGDDRQHVDDHPLRLVAGDAEGVHDLQALDDPGLLLAGGVVQLLAQLDGKLLQVDVGQQLLHGLGTHAGVEIVLILLPQLAVLLLGEDLVLHQGGIAGVGDDIGGKVQDLFQDPGGQVQQQAHAGGDALEVPDVGHRGGQLDVAHPLPADVGAGHFHAAAVADLALIADLLVLAAVALPVLGGAKDALAEQAVPLRLQGAVVDGLRLLDLAIGPIQDLLRGSDTNTNGVKLSIAHISIVLPFFILHSGRRRNRRLRCHRRSCRPQQSHRRRWSP